MDAIAALKWTRANISRFGGNPRQITIAGESAGGAAVNHLMVSPAAKGLFARAIVQSGLGREPLATLANAEKAGVSFAAAAGSGASAKDLRQLNVATILKAGDPDMTAGGGPMIDGKVVTMSPAQGFRAGKEAAVPYIVGWNSLEFALPAALGSIKFAGSPLTAGVVQRAKGAYPDASTYDQNLFSDALFVEPALNLARLHSSHGHPTFVYQFSVLAKSAAAMFKGTPHALDVPYVFQTLNTSPFPTDANDAAQARAISAYWAAFAKTGTPNSGGHQTWPAFTEASGAILDFTNTGPKVSEIPRKAALDVLSSAYSAD